MDRLDKDEFLIEECGIDIELLKRIQAYKERPLGKEDFETILLDHIEGEIAVNEMERIVKIAREKVNKLKEDSTES